ncbi:hypothetical protein AC1031_017435 [Aphanomyces cochlioides]|nr:hypothetical protein AC1031_017435 [Aphanomyces cochlioides]
MGDLECHQPIAPPLDCKHDAAQESIQYIGWPKYSEQFPTYLAAATLKRVHVWRLDHPRTILSIATIQDLPSRVCGLTWNPQTPLLAIHTTTQVHLVSVSAKTQEVKQTNPINATKQYASWNPKGDTLFIAGGSSVATLTWPKANDILETVPHVSVDAMNEPKLGAIVGLTILSNSSFVVSTERNVHVVDPIPALRPAVAVPTVETKSEGIIDLTHVKKLQPSSLLLPELHQNMADVIATAFPRLDTTTPRLSDTQQQTAPSNTSPTTASAILFTQSEHGRWCKTQSLALPQFATPDILHSHASGVIAVASHLTVSAIVLLSSNSGELKIVNELALPSRQIHGLHLLSNRAKLLVRVLEMQKPQRHGFFASSKHLRSLEYRSFEMEMPTPENKEVSRPEEITLTTLQALIETRFDRMEALLNDMDRRLRRLEERLR